MKKKSRNRWLPTYRIFEDGGPTKAEQFMGNANQIMGMASTFDSIAQNISGGIDQSREGVNDQPTQVVEGVLGAQSGSHLNKMWTQKAKLNEALDYIDDQGDVKYNAGDFDQLLNQYNTNGFLEESNINTKGKELQEFLFDPLSYAANFLTGRKRNNTAADRQRKINEAIREANAKRQASFNAEVENINQRNKIAAMRNQFAFGGGFGFNPYIGGALEYDMMKDSLYNKQLAAQNKGIDTFNLAPSSISFAEGGGLDRSEDYGSKKKPYPSVKSGDFAGGGRSYPIPTKADAIDALRLAGLHGRDDVKAKVYKKYPSLRKHAEGGLLSDNFTNGVTFIGNGGTHENNPHEGVQMGIAPDGLPNLVEQGEAIYKDYVFSNRLRVPKEVRQKYKLRGPKDMTFAEAFENAQRESEERENDPISKNGLDNIAMILARTQEAVRGYNKAKGHKAAKGGHLYSGIDDINLGIIEEEDPQTQLLIDNFWKGELGDKWNSDRARRQYLRNRDKKTSSIPSNNIGAARYAETIASAIPLISDAFNLTNNATIFDRVPQFSPVAYRPVGQYAPVTKFDTRYAANQQAAQAAATRAAILGSSSPSKWANLLAADYNAQIANGELLRQAAMDQYNRDLARLQFNRATDQANSQMGLQADMYNTDSALKYAQELLQQDRLNEESSNMASAARAQNIGNFAENIGAMAREDKDREMLQWLIDKGVFGTITAKGGKIRKRKKGLTY